MIDTSLSDSRLVTVVKQQASPVLLYAPEHVLFNTISTPTKTNLARNSCTLSSDTFLFEEDMQELGYV